MPLFVTIAATLNVALAVYFGVMKRPVWMTVTNAATATVCSLTAVKMYIDAAIPHIK